VDWFRRPSLIQLSLQPPDTTGASRNRRGFDPPKRPLDPDSRVRAPKSHGPAGRSSSIAVDEPVDDENVAAVGAPARDAKRAVHWVGVASVIPPAPRTSGSAPLACSITSCEKRPDWLSAAFAPVFGI